MGFVYANRVFFANRLSRLTFNVDLGSPTFIYFLADSTSVTIDDTTKTIDQSII